MIDNGHLPLKHFVGGAPFEVSYRCMVVNVGCVSERKFPSRVRVSRIDRFSLGPNEGGSERGVTVLEGAGILARGTGSCT